MLMSIWYNCEFDLLGVLDLADFAGPFMFTDENAGYLNPKTDGWVFIGVL